MYVFPNQRIYEFFDPGDELEILGVVPKDELNEGYEAVKPYIEGKLIVPFITEDGGSYFCIGFGNDNFGKIYYLDFSFGIFLLSEALQSFISGLVINPDVE